MNIIQTNTNAINTDALSLQATERSAAISRFRLLLRAKRSNLGFILKSPVNTVVGTTSAIKGEIVISVGRPAEESKTFIEIEEATFDT